MHGSQHSRPRLCKQEAIFLGAKRPLKITLTSIDRFCEHFLHQGFGSAFFFSDPDPHEDFCQDPDPGEGAGGKGKK